MVNLLRYIWKNLHLPKKIYTGTARGARDKYQVCSGGAPQLVVSDGLAYCGAGAPLLMVVVGDVFGAGAIELHPLGGALVHRAPMWFSGASLLVVSGAHQHHGDFWWWRQSAVQVQASFLHSHSPPVLKIHHHHH